MIRTMETFRLLFCLGLVLSGGLAGCGDQTSNQGAISRGSSVTEDVTSQQYIAQRDWVNLTLSEAQQAPLSDEMTEQVIDFVRKSPSKSIRVRAMFILPYVKDREQAVGVLIETLNSREVPADGIPLLQTAALKILGDMKAVEASEAIQSWIAFLNEDNGTISIRQRSELLQHAKSVFHDLYIAPSTKR